MNPTPYTVAESSGRIVQSGLCPPDQFESMLAYGSILLPIRSDPSREYVLNGAIAVRPDFVPEVSKFELIADGVDEAILTNLPPATEVIFDGQSRLPDGDSIRLKTTTPGTRPVTLRKFPFREYRFTLKAVAP